MTVSRDETGGRAGQGRAGWLVYTANLVVGAAASTACWLVLVPWDLSTADAQGRVLSHQPTPYTGILLALVLPAGACAVSLVALPRGGRARSVGVVTAWAFLLTWRTMVANVVGANMWAAGLIVVTLPATLLALVILLAIHHLCVRRTVGHA